MIIVSNDPTWWQSISSYLVLSYVVGSLSAVGYCHWHWAMPRSNLDCGFAVASFVVVMYDWGEHGNIEDLLIAYKCSQHLHSAKRYVDAMT
jgi:hypothetical protein